MAEEPEGCGSEEAVRNYDMMFDERGRHELVLSIGHQTFPVDKRQRRIKWRCFVQTESVAIVNNVTFEVMDGMSARGETVTSAPFEIERNSACVSEAIEVNVTVNYQPWTKAPPTRHAHEVVLRPAGRGGTEEKFVVLQSPTLVDAPPISWAEYEAQPGQYIARTHQSTLGGGSSAMWAQRSATIVGAPPPSHQDWKVLPFKGLQPAD